MGIYSRRRRLEEIERETEIRKQLAAKLMGRHVRFNHLPQSEPLTVQSVGRDGMITISGFAGEFAPDCFQLAGD